MFPRKPVRDPKLGHCPQMGRTHTERQSTEEANIPDPGFQTHVSKSHSASMERAFCFVTSTWLWAPLQLSLYVATFQKAAFQKGRAA